MSTVSQFFSFDNLHDELSKVIQNEAAIVSFCKLLEDIRNFANKEIETRNKILVDIAFWKGEMAHRKKLGDAVLRKKDALAYNSSLNKMKMSGVKYTDTMILADKDANVDEAYENLAIVNAIYGKWTDILNDCYFALNSTNKILGGN